MHPLTTKQQNQVFKLQRIGVLSKALLVESYLAIDSYLDSLFFNMRLKLPIIIHPVLQNGQDSLTHQKSRFNNLISILKAQIRHLLRNSIMKNLIQLLHPHHMQQKHLLHPQGLLFLPQLLSQMSHMLLSHLP